MGGNRALALMMARHFFKHLGVPEPSDEAIGSLLDEAEEEMRRSGALGDDEILGVQSRKLSDVEEQDPGLAELKRQKMKRNKG